MRHISGLHFEQGRKKSAGKKKEAVIRSVISSSQMWNKYTAKHQTTVFHHSLMLGRGHGVADTLCILWKALRSLLLRVWRRWGLRWTVCAVSDSSAGSTYSCWKMSLSTWYGLKGLCVGRHIPLPGHYQARGLPRIFWHHFPWMHDLINTCICAYPDLFP